MVVFNYTHIETVTDLRSFIDLSKQHIRLANCFKGWSALVTLMMLMV